ncbi:SRPBCC family protein [Aliidiomarina soli]|uniref:Polyketide cyclase n=1 Tax=Aliidiomarina soli TaxID=1928574 RepID=A0A432WBV7_9GAMM|nr:SRPBCC family protein [Aliidiomarina soli]RUO29557.1 polyketide cyclase [Aliidiomarina soli]
MLDVKHLSTYINRTPQDVYAFASNPENLPIWAAGLASSEVKKDGDVWVADAPFGKVKIRFVQANAFGVMDHDVELDSGVVVHNPMRVVPNGDGSEFIFTLLRQPGMSEEQFVEDAQAVEKDLRTLKTFLEDDS